MVAIPLRSLVMSRRHLEGCDLASGFDDAALSREQVTANRRSQFAVNLREFSSLTLTGHLSFWPSG
jgi:hypothetical protein